MYQVITRARKVPLALVCKITKRRWTFRAKFCHRLSSRRHSTDHALVVCYPPKMLVRITESDGLLLDLRYATSENFTGRALYSRPIALLRPEARDRLLLAAERASLIDLKLKIYDAFRPLEVQRVLWGSTTNRRFVADPLMGGGHNRGSAVDLTLVRKSDGAELEMGTDFDDMTGRSAHDSLEISPEAVRNRALLLGIMTSVGWSSYRAEWWHYHLLELSSCPPLSSADVPEGPM